MAHMTPYGSQCKRLKFLSGTLCGFCTNGICGSTVWNSCLRVAWLGGWHPQLRCLLFFLSSFPTELCKRTLGDATPWMAPASPSSLAGFCKYDVSWSWIVLPLQLLEEKGQPFLLPFDAFTADIASKAAPKPAFCWPMVWLAVCWCRCGVQSREKYLRYIKTKSQSFFTECLLLAHDIATFRYILLNWEASNKKQWSLTNLSDGSRAWGTVQIFKYVVRTYHSDKCAKSYNDTSSRLSFMLTQSLQTLCKFALCAWLRWVSGGLNLQILSCCITGTSWHIIVSFCAVIEMLVSNGIFENQHHACISVSSCRKAPPFDVSELPEINCEKWRCHALGL